MKQDNSTNLSVGTILDGKYRIDRFIKSGGFGKTYETTHTIFEERFAIKEFFIPDICSRRADNSVEVTNSDNKTTYENHRKKFFKEAVRIRRLDHPNIVKVRDVFEANGTAYYVMEYIDGKSLNDLLKERGCPFSEEEVMPWLNDLLSALEYIHNHDPKVLHLDIKPGNIMIRKSDNRAVLIDFGGCKQFEYDNTLTEEENEETRSKLSTSGVVFTKGYAPLEQEDASVEKFNDYTDLYAVGATLFKLLTSKEPPRSSEIVENKGDVPNIPNSMSKNMRNVINRSMQQRREDRPQSVAEFRQILNGKDDDERTEIVKPEPPKPPIPPVPPPPPAEPKRNDIWVWVFVAVVALIIGIVIFKNCKGSDDTPSPPPTTEATEEAITESPVAEAVPVEIENMTFNVNGVSFAMIGVEGGSFMMGSDDSEAFRNEQPVHEVRVSDFWMGETEVTQGLWKAVMGNNPSWFKRGDNYPVERVSWHDCQDFVRKLNELTEGKRPAGTKFRLPTEAEWEYAARGGKHKEGYKFSGSDKIDQVAWYNEDWDTGSTHPVDKKQSNALGINDMSGNVWEWCEDYYDEDYYDNSPIQDPLNTTKASYRVLRGGSWDGRARGCRVSYRNDCNPDRGGSFNGMRLALSSLH